MKIAVALIIFGILVILFIGLMKTQEQNIGCQKALTVMEYENALGYRRICDFIIKGVE